MINLILNPRVEVLIVSYGGVGTTFLAKSISKYKTTNCPINSDGYKHLPIPPIILNKKTRIIFVFGDPVLATISLFKRGFHSWQSVLLQKYYSRKFLIPKESRIEDYSNMKEDGFQFERQFFNWHSKYLATPTLFINYNDIFDNLDIIATFLNLPKEFVETFPAKRKRSSRESDLDEQTVAELRSKYSSFRETLDDSKPYEKRENNSFFRKLRIYFSPLYLRAFMIDFLASAKKSIKPFIREN